MNFTEYCRELAFPARSFGTAVSLISFFLLLSLVSAAGLIGLWLAILVLPAMFRYLIMLVQARARGGEAATHRRRILFPCRELVDAVCVCTDGVRRARLAADG